MLSRLADLVVQVVCFWQLLLWSCSTRTHPATAVVLLDAHPSRPALAAAAVVLLNAHPSHPALAAAAVVLLDTLHCYNYCYF